MRLGLIDLLFAIGCVAIGMVAGQLVASELPAGFRPIAGPVAGICLYLALIYPFYRGLKLLPVIFPRCPCCASFQQGFHILAATILVSLSDVLHVTGSSSSGTTASQANRKHGRRLFSP